jgi:hypothetical protein
LTGNKVEYLNRAAISVAQDRYNGLGIAGVRVNHAYCWDNSPLKHSIFQSNTIVCEVTHFQSTTRNYAAVAKKFMLFRRLIFACEAIHDHVFVVTISVLLVFLSHSCYSYLESSAVTARKDYFEAK